MLKGNETDQSQQEIKTKKNLIFPQKGTGIVEGA